MLIILGISGISIIYYFFVGGLQMDNKKITNVGYLKELIKYFPDDMPVFVGCQGYTNYDFKNQKPFDDTDTFVIEYKGKLFITDEAAIETEDDNTI